VKTKPKRRKAAEKESVRRLLEELRIFVDEYDSDDPEATQISLDEHLSSLLKEGLIKPRKGRKSPHLDDAFESIFRKSDEGVVEQARTFEDLINSYGGEPSDEDMNEAWDILQELIGVLNAHVNQSD
jgi:hypothetical protein